MTSRYVTLALYGMFALVALALEVRSRRSRSSIPPLSTVFTRIMRTRSGRVGVMAGWVWLGLHFFAR